MDFNHGASFNSIKSHATFYDYNNNGSLHCMFLKNRSRQALDSYIFHDKSLALIKF